MASFYIEIEQDILQNNRTDKNNTNLTENVTQQIHFSFSYIFFSLLYSPHSDIIRKTKNEGEIKNDDENIFLDEINKILKSSTQINGDIRIMITFKFKYNTKDNTGLLNSIILIFNTLHYNMEIYNIYTKGNINFSRGNKYIFHNSYVDITQHNILEDKIGKLIFKNCKKVKLSNYCLEQLILYKTHNYTLENCKCNFFHIYNFILDTTINIDSYKSY